jgi:hypothetical protein
MAWWRHAARAPLPPLAVGHHFGAISKRLLEGAEKAQAHRGPDDMRKWFEARRDDWAARMKPGGAGEPALPGPDVRKPFDLGPQSADSLKGWEGKLKDLENKVKALEAKLGAAEAHRAPPRPRHEEPKRDPPKRD